MRFLIVRDYKENRRKCTLTPLEGRADFRFVRLARPASGKPAPAVEIGPGILLEIDGPPLAPGDRALLAGGELVVVDSSWARVPIVLRRLESRDGVRLARRSLPYGFRTAYPRSSKVYRDPPRGLASVEAVFAAAAILGEPDPGLLAGYRWADDFLEQNRSVLEGIGSSPGR
jgi:pre-rRNA-processing protein TSR3